MDVHVRRPVTTDLRRRRVSLSALPFIPYPQTLRHLRWPWITLAAAVCLLTACTKEKQPIGPQIIYAGLGISNRLEVGMTLNEVEKKNAHVRVRRHFPIAMQWWQRPFTPVQAYMVIDPWSGAQLSFDSHGQAPLFRFET